MDLSHDIAYDRHEPSRTYCEAYAKDGEIVLYLEAQDGDEVFGLDHKITAAEALSLIAHLSKAVAELS